MTVVQFGLLVSVLVSLLATLAGLVKRGRLHLCWSFPIYALIVLGCDMATVLWRDRFYTPEFWMIRQALFDAAKVTIAVELAYRVVRAFPGARRTARVSALALLTFSTAVIVAGPWAAGYVSMAEWQPRMVFGVVSLFTLTALVVLWYNLPVQPWHRALIMGFTGYLLVFTVLLNVLHAKGWQVAHWLGVLDAFAYLALTVWWAHASWAPDVATADIPVTVRRRLGLEAA
jgi:hypothetical protein